MIQHNPLLMGVHGAPQAGKDVTFSKLENWVDDFNATQGRAITTRRRGFADKLKWSLARMFYPTIIMEDAIEWCNRLKLDDKKFIGWGEQRKREHSTFMHFEHAIKMREALRYYGTESHRDIFGYDFWVENLLPVYNQEPDEEPLWWSEFVVPADEVSDEVLQRVVDGKEPPPVADICGITDLRFSNEAQRIKKLGGIIVFVQNNEAERKVLEKAMSAGEELHRSDLILDESFFDVILENSDWRTKPHYLGEQVAAMMRERIS